MTDPVNVEAELAALRERVAATDRLADERHAASIRAVAAALVENNRRLALLNEFRAQATDEQKHFVRQESLEAMTHRLDLVRDDVKEQEAVFLARREYDRAHHDLVERVFTLEKSQSQVQGVRSWLGWAIPATIAFLSLTIFLANYLTSH